jgi:hypothetical protein
LPFCRDVEEISAATESDLPDKRDAVTGTDAHAEGVTSRSMRDHAAKDLPSPYGAVDVDDRSRVVVRRSLAESLVRAVIVEVVLVFGRRWPSG